MIDLIVNKIISKKLKDISSSGQLDAEDADQRENLHRLFIYPAMMVPATQSAIIKVLAEFLPSDTYAMDPFMGSGTSLLSCMEFGFHAYGQDINPFAVLLSKAKTFQYEIIELESAYNRIEGRILQDEGDRIDINFRGINKWFTKKAQISFSKIRRAIQEEHDFKIRSFFWVLMSEAVRVGSNDRTTTFKLHKRSDEELQRRNVNVIKEFFQIAKRGIEDYAIFCEKLQAEHNQYDMSFRGDITVKWGNTQKRIETEEKFGLLVSSPPYGDNQTTVTYGQTSYLPLVERKNSLGFGSHEGVKISVIYHTFIETCKMCGVSTLEYFKEFFNAIMQGRTDYEHSALPLATNGTQEHVTDDHRY